MVSPNAGQPEASIMHFSNLSTPDHQGNPYEVIEWPQI